jgi:gamma-glutamyl hercynylcysteine S-oxide synthase
VRFPGGRVEIGTDDRTAAYDNERPRHSVELRPFRIGAAPVTNGEYLRFMDDWRLRRRASLERGGMEVAAGDRRRAPAVLEPRRGGELDRADDGHRRAGRPAASRLPRLLVRGRGVRPWAGARLPTEQEWEAAAAWDPAAGRAYRYPWGDEPPSPLHANLDQLAFGTAQIGAYPRNVSPIGCYGMIGDVWEWTASHFHPYQGYETYPYAEYSEAFFGTEHRVLRGGSWATRPGAVRNTFRNWDYPIRRQIFAGFRLARDD